MRSPYISVLIHSSQCSQFIPPDSTILKQNNQVITKLLLFGNEKLKAAQNKSILTSTIMFLQGTERFKTSLFRVSHSGGAWGGAPPILRLFPKPPIKTDAPHGAPAP